MRERLRAFLGEAWFQGAGTRMLGSDALSDDFIFNCRSLLFVLAGAIALCFVSGPKELPSYSKRFRAAYKQQIFLIPFFGAPLILSAGPPFVLTEMPPSQVFLVS
jgi:hypothetical protein